MDASSKKQATHQAKSAKREDRWRFTREADGICARPFSFLCGQKAHRPILFAVLVPWALFFTHFHPYLSSISCFEQPGGHSRNYYHYYHEFYEDSSSITSTVTSASENMSTIVHNAKFGLGHRLDKMSSAWHLTKSLNITRLQLKWDSCTGMQNIFPLLFGNNSYINVPGNGDTAIKESSPEKVNKKVINIWNDVDGYFDAMNYKYHQVLLSPGEYKGNHSPWLKKLDSNAQFFKILRHRFTGRQDVIKFMEEHGFSNHFVIGMHLRLGNDESRHFKQAGRGVRNEMEFVNNVLDLLRMFVLKLRRSHPERFVYSEHVDSPGFCQRKQMKTPLVFLATDSPKFIPIIANATQIWKVKTIVIPQTRVDSGVTYSEFTGGEKCLQGWHDMLMDMVALSFSDVLVAPRYSSFTQTLPAHLVFDQNRGIAGPSFCECSDTGKTMTCLEDMRTWIFRDDEKKMFHYSTVFNETESPVVHNLVPALPDVVVSDEYYRAEHFLNDSSSKETFVYGSLRGFNGKYRGRLACPDCSDFKFERDDIV